MKKNISQIKRVITTLSVFFIVINGKAQTILNKEETTSRTVQDPLTVILSPGFRASATTVNPFIAKIGNSTETSPESPNNSTAGQDNPTGETVQGNLFHDTKGDISVSGGGQLQYSLPIALPPSINGVAPQMNLSYSSGSGVGIAGMGFSISGLTSINRAGKNIEKDGESKGVQLNYTDFFQFNGQRLLLKTPDNPSIYGKDGTEYVTENLSTLKIKSIGTISGETYTGPASFEVTFDNGSQAWYGTTPESKNPLEYNIVKWKDAQGNYITYNYTKTNNVILIASVQWGGNETMGTSHFNSIVFNYITRNVQEVSYVQGVKFLQDKILSNIVVNANGNQFKKYVVNYTTDANATNYQYVSNVTEYNSQNQASNPVTFSYETSSTSNWNAKSFADNDNDKIIGDFDGDGVLDYLKYFDETPESSICVRMEEYDYGELRCVEYETVPAVPKSIRYFKSFLDNDINKEIIIIDPPSFTKEEFTKAKSITFKNSNGEISARQGILFTRIAGDTRTYQIYSIDDNNKFKFEYEKSVILNTRIYSYESGSAQNGNYLKTEGKTTIVNNALPVDLDGDGLAEVIVGVVDSGYRITYRYDYSSNPIRVIDRIQYYYDNLNYKVLNLDRNVSPENSFSDVTIYDVYQRNLFDKSIIGDFYGDGKIQILGSDAYNTIYLTSFKKDPITQKFSSTNTFLPISFKGFVYNAVIGDFNGDKKTDLIVPRSEGSSEWNLYLATGTSFKEELKSNLMLFKPKDEYSNYCGPVSFGCKKFTEYYLKSYQAIDLDKDGKSELVKFDYDSRQYSGGSQDTSTTSITVFRNAGANIIYRNNAGSNSLSDVNFQSVYTKSFKINGLYGFTELVGDYQINQINNNIVLLGKDRVDLGRAIMYTFNFYDTSKNSRINAINQGNIATNIEYKELDSRINSDFFTSVKKEKYPFVEIDRVSQSFVVSQLRQLDRQQDFKYRGLLAHVNGRGMIGFRKTARSNWYAAGFENTKVWSGMEIDPMQNGLAIKEWTTRTETDVFPVNVSLTNTQLLSLKLLEYNTEKSASGVESIIPFRSTEKDFLKNATKVATMYYTGNYKLIDRVETSINNGFATTISKNEYLPDNPTGIGKDYFIGRISSKMQTVTAYGDTKTTKTAYTFEGNLPKTSTTFNQNLSQSITETYTYDGFGNVIEKNVTNSQDAQTQNTKNEYDTKGLFVIKTTDNLGLISETTYNDFGQVLTQKDPLGNTRTNTYDAWGKLLNSNSNLSGTTTYTYQKQGDDIITTQYDPTGDLKEIRTNKLGQQYHVITKGFESGSYVNKKIEYDLVGRKIRESESYFTSENPKWNTIEYDDSIFPAKAVVTSFNGSKAETQVVGLVTTVKELTGYNRTTKKTTDVLGNLIESEDKGGVIIFAYNAAGQNISATYGQNVVTTKYDLWGRKVEFYDPSNGKYSYDYDGFGKIIKETSPKGTKEYSYNTKGQLISQTELSTDDNAKATNKSITFSYNSKGMLTNKKGMANGLDYLSNLNYDSNGRVVATTESSNGKYYFQKNIVYDDKGRVTSYDKGLYSNSVLTQTSIENGYSTWSGALYQLKDKNTAKTLWQLNTTKANGQVLNANLGAVAIDNQYDANNFLTRVSHSSAVQYNVMQLSYSFDAIKNELKNRSRYGANSINEVFTYDDNNRLISWTNPKTGQLSTNEYDEKGRIVNNDQVGITTFRTDKIYQTATQQLNNNGVNNYTNDVIQTISYNENNDPVYINGEKGDALFSYGLTEMRQKVTYGGNFNPDQGQQGKFTKFYSEDGSFEITTDNTTGKEKHILYIGGSPYESNIIFLKNYNEASAKYLFLHKDYIGSILAITDEAGNAVEQRHFDAWGMFTHYSNSNGATTPPTLAGGLLLDRGYTSHEHFVELGIIHMNGRLYDPLQRRFLNADESINDPNNTQCYNKYGYVMNNPLLYNDPSGEELVTATLLIAAAIGALIGVASYAIGSYISNGSWEKVSLSGTLKAAFWGAVSGAVTYGIGSCFQTGAGVATTFSKTFGGVLVKAAAHGIAQGTLAMMQNNGAGFLSGAAGGFFGSLGATAWGGAGGKWQGIGGKYAGSAVGTIAFGALSGGVGAELSGGNFWQGAIAGGIVAGLNHVMHQMGQNDPPNKYKRYFQNKLRQAEAFYDNNKLGLRQFFDGAEILGGTMEIAGFVAAPFTEGASLVISAEGAFISGFGSAGNMTMDAIEGKWDSFAWRGIQFGAGLGMGRALNHLPQTAGYLVNAVKSFSETYVMPVLEDSYNKFNTPQNKPMPVKNMPNRLKL